MLRSSWNAFAALWMTANGLVITAAPLGKRQASNCAGKGQTESRVMCFVIIGKADENEEPIPDWYEHRQYRAFWSEVGILLVDFYRFRANNWT